MASFSPVELSEYPTPVILIIDIVEKALLQIVGGDKLIIPFC